jgi:hypothetical protein
VKNGSEVQRKRENARAAGQAHFDMKPVADRWCRLFEAPGHAQRN